MFNSFSSIRDFASTFRGLIRSGGERLEDRFPRLIERNLPYHQSRNKIVIQHRHERKSLYKLLRHSWFFVFLRLKTRYSVAILLGLWTLMIMFFAEIYHALDAATPNKDCGLSNFGSGIPITYHGAFGFSLETATTVGYSLPGSSNALFENCIGMTVAIYFQMMISMMFNAFLFAFFYARLAKSESRAIQIVFSNKCVIRETDRGTLVCQMRVYDVDSGHGTVEAHVRLYALLKHKDTDGHPRLEQLRLISPNDDLGAVLFLNLPSVVTHEIDFYSPLNRNNVEQGYSHQYRLSSGGLLLREVDSVTGNREEIMCPVCGETYGDFRRLRMHVKYQQMCEIKDEIPVSGSHRELRLKNIPRRPNRPSLSLLQERLPLQELICVVEGIDPLVSAYMHPRGKLKHLCMVQKVSHMVCCLVRLPGHSKHCTPTCQKTLNGTPRLFPVSRPPKSSTQPTSIWNNSTPPNPHCSTMKTTTTTRTMFSRKWHLRKLPLAVLNGNPSMEQYRSRFKRKRIVHLYVESVVDIVRRCCRKVR